MSLVEATSTATRSTVSMKISTFLDRGLILYQPMQIIFGSFLRIYLMWI